ncbi:virulence factor Mce family protein [Actinomadura craniellae]|uniref:Virulence factor Mce family protein n=1 Tax=Actinomadura craniellae TaxID=2231787 RepID=A0A365H818_9ACTN|nr:MCE family protein [Actinomadura craniellae]RAY15168.1 virulence factor Mce family protein [Actinomadura craniellae]
MTNRPLLRLCAVALAGAAVLSGCSFRGVDAVPLPGGPDLGADPYEVRIEFQNVLDLVPQSAVKVNDVSVGKVTKIELDGWRARVTVKVRKDVRLPDNARAGIGQTSLLGEKFISLAAPTTEAPQGALGQGDLIPLRNTTRNTEVEEVLSAMSLLLNGGGIEQIATITHELRTAMDGREQTIKSVLHQVDTFVGTLDRHRGAIVRALDSIDRLSGKLAAERRTIEDTIDRAGPAIKVLDQNRADLTKMLVALDELSKTTTRVVNASKADLLVNLKALEPILANLNKAGTHLPRQLEAMITFPFPHTFSNVLRGDYGNVHMTLDLDMKSLARNLLGGTELDALTKQGAAARNLLRPPDITLPQQPPGVLPQRSAGAPQPGPGLPTLPALPTLLPSPPAARPRAASPVLTREELAQQQDLYTLLMGGLS